MAEYKDLTPEQKLAHWKAFKPATPEMARTKRQAIRQFGKAAKR